MKISDINYNELSPMMKQYVDIKKNYQDEFLFYRVGDFYELFFEDALKVVRELDLTLTGKNGGLKERIPMAGVPHHAGDDEPEELQVWLFVIKLKILKILKEWLKEK